LNQAIIEPGGILSRAQVSFDPNRIYRFAKVNEHEVPPGPLLFRMAINTFDENWRRDHLLCLRFKPFSSIYDHKKSPDQQGSFLT